jgi:DNA polymerase (family X)
MMNNRQIAEMFDKVADMLTLKGEIIHRVLAYRRAAEAIRDLPRDVRAVASEGALTSIDGVGKIIAEKIVEMLETNHLRFYDELAQEIPPGLVDVLRVNGVGPKKAMLFYQQLEIRDLPGLEAAARAGKLKDLPGMGGKSEAKILEGIEALARRTNRQRLDVATHSAERLLAPLLMIPGVLGGDIAGSVRRGKPTIGDLDLVVATLDAAPVMEAFVHHHDVQNILAQGPTKSSVELGNGLQCDLRVVPPDSYGTALQYFTGSKEHNTKLREIAREKGYTLNEWALTRLDTGQEILCSQESDVYKHLGLAWIPPELREDRGELDLASRGALPTLIEVGHIRADLHMHTTWSDGKLTIRDMAWAARERGLTHIVITDHSRSLGVANGLSIERLMAQQEEVRAVDAEFAPMGLRLLHGVEMDILADGTLDYPDEVLAKLDFVIASLHVSLRQPRSEITSRLLNAINNPHVDLIAHPRGQLIPEREPADLDMDAVFAAAQQTDTALEINANPYRLDLDDVHARQAAEMGIKIAIDTDAHNAVDFTHLHFGVKTARRARLGPEAVINTWPLERLLTWLSS